MSRQDNIQFKVGYNLGKKAIKEAYNSKREDITKQDELEVLDFLIDLSLMENSKKLFDKYTTQKNELLMEI